METPRQRESRLHIKHAPMHRIPDKQQNTCFSQPKFTIGKVKKPSLILIQLAYTFTRNAPVYSLSIEPFSLSEIRRLIDYWRRFRNRFHEIKLTARVLWGDRKTRHEINCSLYTRKNELVIAKPHHRFVWSARKENLFEKSDNKLR